MNLNVAGGEIYYETMGAGSPIIFLHDGLIHSAGFDSQFEFFARAHTVVRYDRLGYGKSKIPVADYSDVEILKALYAHLKIEQAILLGGSAGGQLAIDFALAYPSQVKALVLVGAAIRGMVWTDHSYYRGWRNTFPEKEDEWFEFWTNDPYFIAPENESARQFMRDLLRQYPHNLIRFDVERLDKNLESIKRLSEIHTSTLVLIGEHDIPDNHAQAGILQYGIPNAEREIIAHSGHVPYIEQAQKFNELVAAFLEKHK
ncbi:MAG: alpha/beta hydrolase [Chloroflexi bacterium]|nr:alpha/beta hydrolase [Chloroflexota bacterium]